MDSTKKISFGFSKLKQSSQLVKPVEIKKEEIQYVDSFDGEKGKFSFQGTLRLDEEVKKPLVIPLIGTKSAYEVIKNKLEAKDGANSLLDESAVVLPTNGDGEVKIKEEKDAEGINKEPITLDALAAKEILQGIKKEPDGEESDSGPVIVPEAKPTFEGEKESTLEDYENVPVGDYGLALLRGMGWTPKTGIGKDNKVVAPVSAKLRPKRLGLGAEVASILPGERPPLKKGCLIKVAVGQHKGDVGVVESLDGDTASVFVKLEISGNLSLSENVVQAITKKEYEDIKNNGGPKIEVATKPSVEKKYGIVFKDDEPKKPISNEDKPRHERTKSIPKEDKFESHRRDRLKSPERRRRDHSSPQKEPSSRKEKYNSSSRTDSRSKRRDSSNEYQKKDSRRERQSKRDSSLSDSENSRKRRRSRSKSKENTRSSKKHHSKVKSSSDSDSDDEFRRKKERKSRKRKSSSENERSKRRNRSGSRSTENVIKKKKSNKKSSSSGDERKERRGRSNSSEDLGKKKSSRDKHRTKKSNEKEARKKKKRKEKMRSSSSESGSSRKRDNSSSEEERRKKKKKRKKSRRD